MTKDEIMTLANQTSGQHWMDEAHILRFSALLEARSAAAECEACIAAIQGQIDHAHINELRLVPRFGKRLGEIAVRADDLEAALDGLRARGQA